jgi:hypothetical protein
MNLLIQLHASARRRAHTHRGHGRGNSCDGALRRSNI